MPNDIGYNKKKKDMLYNKYGSNFKMSDISAAFILAFLENFISIKAKHEELYLKFSKEIQLVRSVKMFPSYIKPPFSNCLPLLFDKPVQLEQFIEHGICAGKYYKPLTKTPIAMYFYERIICLPLNIDITDADFDHYLSVISSISGNY